MGNYEKIAQKSWSVEREDGSTRQIQLTVEERSGVAKDLPIPLVQDIQVIAGNSSDEVNKPIKVHQLVLQLKDSPSAGDLISKIDGCGWRQLRITFTDVTNSYVEFQGYIMGQHTRFGLYEQVQSIKVRATGQLADLTRTPVEKGATPQDEYRTIAAMGDEINASLELPRGLDVYTSMRHEGETQAELLPEQLRGSIYEMAGSDAEGNLLAAVTGMAVSLGWQVFQHDGKLVFGEPWERYAHPTSVNSYTATGGSFAHGQQDLQITLDETNVIRGGEITSLPTVKNYTQTQIFNTRGNPQFPDGMDGVQGAQTFTGDVFRGGDIISFSYDGELTVGAITDSGSVEVDFLEIKLINTPNGQPLWFHPGGEEGSWKPKPYSFQTGPWSWAVNPHSGDVFHYGYSAGAKLAAIPDGMAGNVQIKLKNDVTYPSGDGSTGVEHQQVSFSVDETDDPKLAHSWRTHTNAEIGKKLGSSYFVGDIDEYSDRRSYRWKSEGPLGIWEETQQWVDPAGNDTLGVVVARRMGTLTTGDRKKFEVKLRDLQRVSLLNVLRITDNQGNPRKAMPVEIKHFVLRGYYKVTAVAGFEAPINITNFYSPDVPSGTGTAETTTTGGGIPGGGGSSGGGGGSSEGVTDHGHLTGLDDPNDHPWAAQLDLSNIPPDKKDDARQNIGLGPTDTPSFAQTILNNPASQDNQALRAGQTIGANTPLSVVGSNKLRDGVKFLLNYISKNFKITNGKLNTIQDIDEDADMVLNKLLLKQGLTIDDLIGSYIESKGGADFDWIGEGFGITKDADGDWNMVLDNLTVRERLKIFELMFQEITVFAAFLLNEGNEVDQAAKLGDGTWTWLDMINPFTDTHPQNPPTYYAFTNTYRCYVAENTRVQLAVDDLVRRQAFGGTGVGLTDAVVIGVEHGKANVNDNSIQRYFDIRIVEGAPPKAGDTFARLGNLTDETRQGGIYFSGSGQGSPHEFMYDGVDSFAKFGTSETIKSFEGNTKGRSFKDFPQLDGHQGTYYASVIQNGFFSGDLVSKRAFLGDEKSNFRFIPGVGAVLTGTLLQRNPGEDTVPVPLNMGDWKANVTYYKGDVVTLKISGKPYQYILTNADTSLNDKPSVSNIWELYVASGEKGDPAPLVKVQYSVDGTGGWHSPFQAGDFYIRTSTDGGSTWSNPAKIVGEDGTDGQPGTDGSYVEYQFAKNTSLSSAPSSGWSDGPPSVNENQYIWMRKRTVSGSGNPGSWSTAVRISGPPGPKGEKGDPGKTGPVPAYTGAWQAGVTYYNNDVRQDLVTHNSIAYAYVGTDGDSSSTFVSGDWQQAGVDVKFVATDLGLTKKQIITQKLILGEEGTDQGVIESANYDGDHGFMLQAQGGHADFQSADLGDWRVSGGNIEAGQDMTAGPYMRHIAGNKPLIEMKDATGQLWSLASELAASQIPDETLDRTADFQPDITNVSTLANADTMDTYQSDTDQVTGTSVTSANIASFQGRLFRFSVPCSFSFNSNRAYAGAYGSVNVSVVFRQGTTTVHTVSGNRTTSGTIQLVARVPDNADEVEITIEATSVAYVGASPPPGVKAYSEASTSMVAKPITITSLHDGISPKGASWTDDDTGNRVVIDRDTGRVTQNEVYIESQDGNGDCILVMERNDLKIQDQNGNNVAVLQDNIN